MTYIVKSFWEDVTITAKRIKIISFCTSIIAYLIVSLIFSFKPNLYISFLMLGFSSYIYLVRLDVLDKSKKTTITERSTKNFKKFTIEIISIEVFYSLLSILMLPFANNILVCSFLLWLSCYIISLVGFFNICIYFL